MQKVLLSILLGGLCLHAADGAPESLPATAVQKPDNGDYRKPTKLWTVSAAVLLASNLMDVKSSWGKRELNPVLQGTSGTFGGKGSLLKLGVEGGVIAVEYLMLRHHPSRSLEKALTWINFGDASLTTGMAVRNFGIPGR
jgi:hypothetical protein